MCADIDSAKSVTRREVRRSRAGLNATEAAGLARSLAARLPDVLARLPTTRTGPLIVAVYVSLPGEPGTGPLREQLHALGHEVLLPVLRDDRDLDWVRDEGPAGTPDHPGPAPSDPMRPPGPLLGVDRVRGCHLVLVPALAVDGAGTRLGQGGGSYDRSLARLARPSTGHRGAAGGPLVLAVLHDDEVLPGAALAREAHDVAVDGALTPSGLRLLRARG